MSLDDYETRLAAARLLAVRMERLSVDSHWARRASGLRGSLIKALEQADAGPDGESIDQAALHAQLGVLVERGFEILNRAAREIRTPEEWLGIK